ncbi:MAG: hypothetical protein KKE17_12630, partial [Proteobacteria bacterium]|nr:hypothetical protein [Pseudomonadota bacterium]MBU1710842.1 hypothetical protein [Pseudomonadota bacterium]
YQQQQINPSKFSPDLKKRTEEMVHNVSLQVTSRTSLEEVVKRYDLYPEQRKNLPMEDVIFRMRSEDIQVTPEKQGDIFRVSYKGSNPKKVQFVTNALAAKFIEENLRFREERATETSAYVQDELRMAKEGLDKKEAVMRDYKLKHYNELPEQLPINTTRLNALQEQYQNNQTNVQSLEHTRLLVQEQITFRKDMIENLAASKINSGGDPFKMELGRDAEQNREILKKNLESLRAKYTEEHPDIKRLKRQLEMLEKETAPVSGPEGEETPVVDLSRGDKPVEQLGLQLKEIEFNIERLKNERVSIRQQIEQYQQWATAAPIREAEWSSLTRDYNELKKHYEGLVARGLEADSAESLERRQKGSQFKIVDPAYYPEKPINPDFRKVLLMAVVCGLGVGFGIVFCLEFFDTSFKDAGEVEDFLGLPVICAIPVIQSDKDKKRKIVFSILWTVLFIITVLAIGGGMAYLYLQGLIII